MGSDATPWPGGSPTNKETLPPMPSTDAAEFDPATTTPPWQATAGHEPITITDVTTVCTAPDGIRLVLIKVQTSDAGLHGWGCATFTQRPLAVVTAVEQYLRPFLVGRNPDDIEDIWQASSLSSYWRSGPVLNNALAGVDMALWDIKGKRAGLPVHQLFGGRTRRAADVYVHANGHDFSDLTEQVRRYLDLGFRHVRCQVEVPGYSTYGKGSARIARDGAAGSPAHLPTRQDPWEPRPYCRTVPRMFEHIRSEVGDDVELLHDVHERVPPIMAIQLAKDLEPYQLFFLEDVVSPKTANICASCAPSPVRRSRWASCTSTSMSMSRSCGTVL